MFQSTFVTNGAMGLTTTAAERSLVFASTAGPGKSGRTQLNIRPSSPEGARPDSLVFKTGLKWVSEAGSPRAMRLVRFFHTPRTGYLSQSNDFGTA